MAEPLLKAEFLEDLDRLTPDLRWRVQQFAHALVTQTPPGTAGETLLPFFGILDPQSADEMEAAIQEHCEQVETNAW